MAAWRMVEDGERLRIEHPSRSPLTVAVEGWRFVVRTGEREVGRFSFFDVREVGRRASEALRHAGRAEPYTLALDAAAVPHPMVIAGRLLGTRERLLAAIDPRVRAVRDRLAPLTRELPQIVCAEALYRDPWIVRDVLRYDAAAVALAFVETRLRPSTLVWDATTPAGEAALVAALRDWRGLFSPSGRSYRSLDRTLMRLAPGVAGERLCRLRRLKLARPYTDPLELTALLAADVVYERTDRPEVAATHLRAVMLASGAEIAAAVRRVRDALEERLDPRRPADLQRALAIVADFPEPHCGRLSGLVERALRWHRVAPDLRAEAAALGGTGMPTRRPPVPLPDDPRITFLSTVGAVLEEGDRMRHCVGSYARRATTGGCYLFHVDYGGHEATVEVDQGGTVSQSCGPCNRRNAATTWGRHQLGRWGLDLMPVAARRRLRLRAARRRRAGPQPAAEQLSLFPTA
jgi:hypothetical protein